VFVCFSLNNPIFAFIGTIIQETMFYTDTFMARSRCLFSFPSYLSLWLTLFLLSLYITDLASYGHSYEIKYPPLHTPLETHIFVQHKRGPAHSYQTRRQQTRLELC